MQLRNVSGSSAITISDSGIDISTSSITLNGITTIEGIRFMGHKHSGVQSGGSTTGGVSGWNIDDLI